MPDEQTTDDLGKPPGLDEIYRARGDEVEIHRPRLQGDVSRGIALPGLDDDDDDDEHSLALIVDHPCSMRSGVQLRERVQMVRVRPKPDLPKDKWPTGHYCLFPLPELIPGDKRRYAAFFDEVAMVPHQALQSEGRIACLSELGILLLQQRLVHHLTRVIVRPETLREASISILEEADLQEDWSATLAIPAGIETLADALAREEQAFDEFLGQQHSADGTSRREALKNTMLRSAVRRAVQKEINRRRGAI